MMLHVAQLTLAALLVVYLLMNAFAWFGSERMIFPAPYPSYEADESIRFLEDQNGESIATIFLPAGESAPLLLYNHGNGEDLGWIRPLLETFRARGIAVLAYDYPGYGLSSGRASEAGCYAAADRVFQHAVETLGYRPEAIRLYGRSVGSGPACYLAERYPVAGLILDGAFTSTFRVLTRIKVLPFDRFDNQARLPRIKCPILILHSKGDAIIPIAHALQNARTVGPRVRTLWVDKAGHNNLIDVAGPTYWETVLPFIENPTDHEP